MRRSSEERDELVSVTYDKLIRQTDKAVLVSVDGLEEWVAKSQIDNLTELEMELRKPSQEREDEGVITVPHWLAAQNGWADDDDE